MRRRIVEMELKYMDQVMAIERASFLDPWPASAFTAELEHNWSFFRLIGLVDWMNNLSKLEGFVICWILRREMHLLSLAVDNTCRRQGLGKTLLKHAEDFFAEKGGGSVSLEVRESNKTAQAFYLSLGFEVVCQRLNYYRYGNENALIMMRQVEPWSVRPTSGASKILGR